MMNTQTDSEVKNSEPLLDKERGQTDDSLNAERGKTDDSLFDLRRKAECEADAQVSKDRKHSDDVRALNRSARDLHVIADEVLNHQRLVDDKAVQTERTNADAAIQTERDQKDKVLAEFLLREREETDENLSHERTQTDIMVFHSSQLLTKEVNSHSQTKAELTTRDELVAIVSHDLRNPIGSVLSCAEMLLEDPSYARMGTELKYWIELIKRNAETSLRLIRDILDMERIAEGKLEVRLKAEDLGVVVRQTVDSFVHVAAANRILLKVIPLDEPVLFNFDRDRISQVLSNLIGNALKFTPEGGSVTVSIQATKSDVIVSVIDTGIGIPEDQKERIFVRYAQLGNKDRRGLGLGLYISKMLIVAHRGRLWVASVVGQGSAFHFSLPRAPTR